MKHMHKLLSVIVVLALAMSLAVPAFADDVGRFEINNAIIGKTYKSWYIAQASEGGYTVVTEWRDAVEAAGVAMTDDGLVQKDDLMASGIAAKLIKAVEGKVVDKSVYAESETVSMKLDDSMAIYLLNVSNAMMLEASTLDSSNVIVETETPTIIVVPSAGNDTAKTYKIYKIFDLSYSDRDGGTYSYTIDLANSAWKNFVTGSGDGAQYVTVDEDGLVTWKGDKSSQEDAAAFAAAAKEYAKAQKLTPEKTDVTTTGSVEFSNLELGYYLVDSSVGALCALTSTDWTAEITDKNSLPTLTKYVEGKDGYGTDGSYAIGDTVFYRIVVKAETGAENYRIHDKLEEGLSFNENSLKVYATNTAYDFNDKEAALGTDITDSALLVLPVEEPAEGQENPVPDGCTFHVDIDPVYLNNISATTYITLEFTAELNEDAEVFDNELIGGEQDQNTNDNTAWLTYGDDAKTENSIVEVTTYIVQFAKTDSSNKLLEGAKFKLYDEAEEGSLIALVYEDGVYRLATDEEAAVEGFVSAIIEGSTPTIVGLESDKEYWLEEIEAPVGYNKLSVREKIVAAGSNAEIELDQNGDFKSGYQVINKTGSLFPETGGIGTTIFYIVGGLMAVGAAVLLVTKRRMTVGE